MRNRYLGFARGPETAEVRCETKFSMTGGAMQNRGPKTIATINFKGGVGKTTVTWSLGDVVSSFSRQRCWSSISMRRCR